MPETYQCYLYLNNPRMQRLWHRTLISPRILTAKELVYQLSPSSLSPDQTWCIITAMSQETIKALGQRAYRAPDLVYLLYPFLNVQCFCNKVNTFSYHAVLDHCGHYHIQIIKFQASNLTIISFAFNKNFVTFRPISISTSLQHYLFLILI